SLGVVGNGNVWEAVTVYVELRESERLSGSGRKTGFPGLLLEGAVSSIPEEAWSHATIELRRAVGESAILAGTGDVGVRRPCHVIAYEQIQPTIPVGVKE